MREDIQSIIQQSVNKDINEVLIGRDPLLVATAKRGYTDIIEKLIDTGAEVNHQAKYNMTALISAAMNGYTEAVEALIAKGADINLQTNIGKSALMFAARNGHKDTVEALISAGANINTLDNKGMSALMFAVKGIWEGFEPDNEPSDDDADAVREMLAVRSRNYKIVEEVVGGDYMNPDEVEFHTELQYANTSTSDHTNIVKMLINAGADVNQVNHSQETVLANAVRGNRKDFVELLIAAGADAGHQVYDLGNSTNLALRYAIRRQNQEITEILALGIEGANLNNYFPEKNQIESYIASPYASNIYRLMQSRVAVAKEQFKVFTASCTRLNLFLPPEIRANILAIYFNQQFTINNNALTSGDFPGLPAQELRSIHPEIAGRLKLVFHLNHYHQPLQIKAKRGLL